MLQDYLAINIFHFILLFARLGVVFLLMPGLSASYVPVRLRLIVSLMVAILALPLVQGTLPAQPNNVADLAWLVAAEVLIGGFLGGLTQIIMAAIALAGQLISTAAGITNAFIDDPIAEEQSSILLGFLNLIAVVMIFLSGSHEFMIMAIVDSYNLLKPGAPLIMGDLMAVMTRLFDQSFYMGVRLAAPFLVFEMVFQVTSGVMARLSPQLNVFFVVLPGKIMMGMLIMMIALPTIMLVFLRFFDSHLHGLLEPLR